jgi:hypothetical protein
MTAWTYVWYSVPLEATPRELGAGGLGLAYNPDVAPWVGRYVRVRVVPRWDLKKPGLLRATERDCLLIYGDQKDHTVGLVVCVARDALPEHTDKAEVELQGRVVRHEGKRWTYALVDTTASRFHPASVAGLVVGAMGAFVFGLYLRRWMKERGKSLTAEGAEVGEEGR